jgi:thiamine monophosphate kinase
MQNFIGPLSDEAKQHAETHAANGTDPLTPEAIGAASEFYAENLAQSAEIAAQAHTNQAIASHLSNVNPHQISPSLIGAAPASHSHAASAINSGQLAIAYGGTGASTAAAARENLGLFAIEITNFTFNEGWLLHPSSPARFYKSGSIVTVNGVFARHSGVNQQILSIPLPSTIRPLTNLALQIICSYGGSYKTELLQITTAGEMKIFSMTLTGQQFPAIINELIVNIAYQA